jgi:predicted O-linked N-acetylglucosamine transferase (SPINDLY family)
MFAELTNRAAVPIAFSQSHYPAAAARVGERFGRSGVKAWFYPRLTEEGYAEVLMRSAVSIDTPYYNGGITAIEALTMGVPIVTHPTSQMRGRFGKAFMEHVGMGDWVATSREDYVEKALNWQEMREALAKANPEALYEDAGVTEALNNWILNG